MTKDRPKIPRICKDSAESVSGGIMVVTMVKDGDGMYLMEKLVGGVKFNTRCV